MFTTRNWKASRGDIQASNSALKSSVDYLAASQTELRSKVISSVENLWQAVWKSRRAYSKGLTVLCVFTPKELDDCFGKRAKPEVLKDFESWVKESDGSKRYSDTTEMIKKNP